MSGKLTLLFHNATYRLMDDTDNNIITERRNRIQRKKRKKCQNYKRYSNDRVAAQKKGGYAYLAI